jgi:AcrR family transcriptional regulator
MAGPRKRVNPKIVAPERQRAKRRRPNLNEIVDVTMELLLEHGEGGFRIEDLIERTGVSKSSLYLHFGSRDGLIAKACLEIFSRQVTANVDAIIDALESISTPAEFKVIIPQIIATVTAQEDAIRWNRTMVMAAARHRPDMWEELGKAQMRFNGALEESIRTLQERRILRADVSARELALMVQALPFGRVLRDLDPMMGARRLDDWNKLLEFVYFAFLAE